MVAVHPQLLCLCLTVRAPLSGLFQRMKATGGQNSILTGTALGMLTHNQMSTHCLMLLPPISAPTRQNMLVSQLGLRTATDHIEVTAGTAETAGIAAAASALMRACTAAAQVTALQTLQGRSAIGRGMPLAMSPGLSLGHTTWALTDR